MHAHWAPTTVTSDSDKDTSTSHISGRRPAGHATVEVISAAQVEGWLDGVYLDHSSPSVQGMTYEIVASPSRSTCCTVYRPWHIGLLDRIKFKARDESRCRRALIAVHLTWQVYITCVQVCLTDTPEPLYHSQNSWNLGTPDAPCLPCLLWFAL